MNTSDLVSVPGRLHSTQLSQDPAFNHIVSGADEVYDDDLQMSQKDINSFVFDRTITTGMTVSPTVVFAGAQSSISLAASVDVDASSIKIMQGSREVANGSGRTLNGTDSIQPGAGNVIYEALFSIGDVTKSVTKSVASVYPIKYGAGASYENVNQQAPARISPAGTYTIEITQENNYVWFVIPATMTINKATMSGFEYPLEAPQNVLIDNISYKAYRSSSMRALGTETIVLS